MRIPSGRRANLKSLDQWLLGWRGSLVGVVSLVLIGWKPRITPLLLGGIFILPLGYVFFWYEGIQIAGPVYYFEVLPFLMVGPGMGIHAIQNRLDSSQNLTRVIVFKLWLCSPGHPHPLHSFCNRIFQNVLFSWRHMPQVQ